jgi:aminocarboxymuconate-semialdehyde decarboxylase
MSERGAEASAGTQTRRREVVVQGRRVTVIDLHAHCAVPEAEALVTREGRGGTRNPNPNLTLGSVKTRLQAMDEQGIDIEALSINPYWYELEPGLAEQVIDLQNQKLAEFVGTERQRFQGLASVALQHPELAAEQLETGVKKYGLKGALIGGSVNGQELADPKFHPFWAKAEQLGALIFIHPQGTDELESRLQGNGILTNVIGNPLETTIALSHLIFEGTLDQFPGVKILAAHGGGYLPSYAARSDAGGVTFPARFTPLKKKPTEYLKQLYYDSLVFTAEGLRHLVAEVGVSQVVLGTDYPYPWTSTAVDHVLNTPELSDDDRVAILGGTAAKLIQLEE